MKRNAETIPPEGRENNATEPFQGYPSTCTKGTDAKIMDRPQPAFLTGAGVDQCSGEQRPCAEIKCEIQNKQHIAGPGECREPVGTHHKKDQPARVAEACCPQPIPSLRRRAKPHRPYKRCQRHPAKIAKTEWGVAQPQKQPA